jgi:hypothetical protein
MVVDRNMQELPNFIVNLFKILINVHLLVNELCEYYNSRRNYKNYAQCIELRDTLKNSEFIYHLTTCRVPAGVLFFFTIVLYDGISDYGLPL